MDPRLQTIFDALQKGDLQDLEPVGESKLEITQLFTTTERRVSGDNGPRFLRREDNFRPFYLANYPQRKVEPHAELLEEVKTIRGDHPYMAFGLGMEFALQPPIKERLFFSVEPLNEEGKTIHDPRVGTMKEQPDGGTIFEEIPRTQRDILKEVQQACKDEGKPFPLHERVIIRRGEKVLRPEHVSHHRGKEVG